MSLPPAAAARITGLIERADSGKAGKVLRFSEAVAPGRYKWASCETGSIEVMQLLVALYNARHDIAAALAQPPETKAG